MTADEEKRDYAYHWSANAGSLASQGCYDWMAEQLDGLQPRRVLDVGGGTGAGLLALRRRFGCHILSLEENPYCLRQAATLLRKSGAKVLLKHRLEYRDLPDGRHVTLVDTRPISLSREVILLQGDPLLADGPMFEFLHSRPKFDAVTIWLMGATRGRRTCVNIDNFQIADSTEYRLHVQDKVYELAARVLRAGGLLQMVDRGEFPLDKAQREDIFKAHREVASEKQLEGLKIAFRRYEELISGRGTMVAGTSSEGSASTPNALHSIVGRRL